MVEAHTVMRKSPKKLSDIEAYCFPWHFFAFDDILLIGYEDSTYTGRTRGAHLKFFSGAGFGYGVFVKDPVQRERRNDLPTIDYLNGSSELEIVRNGLTAANPDEAFRATTLEETGDYRTRGISKRLVFDVRNFAGGEKQDRE